MLCHVDDARAAATAIEADRQAERAARRAREIAEDETRGWSHLSENTLACTRCGSTVTDRRGESLNRDRHDRFHSSLEAAGLSL